MSQNRPAPSAAPPAKSADTPCAVKRESTLELAATLFTREQLKAALADMGASPQIALAGRSNVGKSSLLNALARRKQLAKVSSTPGKTRSVNLFRVVPEGFYVTDLPGYGYAKCSQEERKSWAKLIEYYLTQAPRLKALAQDCIHGIDKTLTLHDFRIVTGPTHTNLIFDVVTPYDFSLTDSELTALIQTRIQEQNPSYFTVIEVDKQMV